MLDNPDPAQGEPIERGETTKKKKKGAKATEVEAKGSPLKYETEATQAPPATTAPAPTKTFDQLLRQPNITFKELYDSWPLKQKITYANKIRDILTGQQFGNLGLSTARSGTRIPGLNPAGSMNVPYAQREASYIAHKGEQVPLTQDQLRIYFGSFLGKNTALSDKWLSMANSRGPRIPKPSPMLLLEVLSVVQSAAAPQPVTVTQGRVLETIAGSLPANSDQKKAMFDSVLQRHQELLKHKEKLKEIRKSKNAADQAKIDAEILVLESQIDGIQYMLSSAASSERSKRGVFLELLRLQARYYSQVMEIIINPESKKLGQLCSKVDRALPQMNKMMYEAFTFAVGQSATRTIQSLRTILVTFRDNDCFPIALKEIINKLWTVVEDMQDPAEHTPAMEMDVNPIAPVEIALQDERSPRIAPPQIGEEDFEEDISDIKVDDIVSQYVRSADRPMTSLSDCMSPARLTGEAIERARGIMGYPNYQGGIINPIEYMHKIETIKSEGNPPTANAADKLFSAVMDPLMEMIRQHLYYGVNYRSDASFPAGLTALSLVATKKISIAGGNFPVTSFYPNKILLSLRADLRMQKSMYRNSGDDESFKVGCVCNCTTKDETSPNIILFYPKMCNTQGDYMGNSPIIAKPPGFTTALPQDAKDKIFHFCSWSPAPRLMASRNPNISELELRDFVLPGSIIERGQENKKGRAVWEENLIQDRVFLTFGDSKNGCGYRMGRFVCQGSGTEDAYYAWMAEMGAFKNYYFHPLQNVTIFFTHRSQAEFDQFSIRSKLNMPGMLPFCGYIRVMCCVPGADNDYENQDWLGCVMYHVDGSLRSFLDGPDVEILDGDKKSLYGDISADQKTILSYYTQPLSKDFTRFKSGYYTMEDLWSSTLTMLHIFNDITKVCNPMVHDFKLSNSQNYNLCPEEFVYTARGMSMSGGPMSLKMYKMKNGRPRFGRATPDKIILNRSTNRPDVYKFMSLGIGGSCITPGTIDGVCDYYTRCAGADGDFSQYPRSHSSDPFVPVWALDKSVHDWLSGQDPEYQLGIRRHIMAEQQMILLRYIALKMKLGLGFVSGDINEMMALFQYREVPPGIQNTLHEKLLYYCKEKADMALFAAQNFDSRSDAWCNCFDAVTSTLGPALQFPSVQGVDMLTLLVSIQHYVGIKSPFMAGVNGWIREGKPMDAEKMKVISDFDEERHKGLMQCLDIAISTVEQYVIPQSKSEIYKVDKTPMK